MVWPNNCQPYLADEQNQLAANLEKLKQELGLTQLSYDKHVQHVVDYYAMFYTAYELAQRTEQVDLIRHPDREDLDTKKDYLATSMKSLTIGIGGTAFCVWSFQARL